MTDYVKLYKAAYEAFLQAAIESNGAYKNLSWFARNKPKQSAGGGE